MDRARGRDERGGGLNHGHVLIVGGTGMLAGAASALAQTARALTLVSRRGWHGPALTHPDPISDIRCDWSDAAAIATAFDRAAAQAGPFDLALVWSHSASLAVNPAAAARTGRAGAPGRFFHVLGSAVGDPSRPDRLDKARALANPPAHCLYRQIVLGFVIEGAGSRWLTNDEISQGTLQAIADDAPLFRIGTTEPWERRPRD